MLMKYRPVDLRMTVADFIVPTKVRWNTVLIAPIFGSFTVPCLKSTVYDCGTMKDCSGSCFFLKVGSSARPSKKFVNARERWCIDCCSDWALTSFSHGNSSLSIGSWFMRAYPDRLIPSL